MNGLILLNKPIGMTSRFCVNQVNKILNFKKIGHLGTLDPDATGMLPLCVGEATKFGRFIVEQDKCYTVKIKFGIQTSTADLSGSVIRQSTKVDFSREQILSALSFFQGQITQTVPIVSAVRVNGKRLYEYARNNQAVTLPTRQVTIHSMQLIDIYKSGVMLQVICSKGTYIRSLAEDIAGQLGTFGCVESLHRDWVNPFQGWEMVDLNNLKTKNLITLNKMFASYSKVMLSNKQKQALSHGLVVSFESQDIQEVALYDASDNFFGMGEIKQNQLKSLRLMSF